jgi:hypothetical protein
MCHAYNLGQHHVMLLLRIITLPKVVIYFCEVQSIHNTTMDTNRPHVWHSDPTAICRPIAHLPMGMQTKKKIKLD